MTESEEPVDANTPDVDPALDAFWVHPKPSTDGDASQAPDEVDSPATVAEWIPESRPRRREGSIAPFVGAVVLVVTVGAAIAAFAIFGSAPPHSSPEETGQLLSPSPSASASAVAP